MSDAIFFAPLKVPVTDSRTGLMSREWYLFFQAIFLRIGGTQAFSADDQQLVDDMNDATGSTIRTTDLESALTDEPQSSADIAELQALALSEEPIIARFTAQWDGLTPASNGGTVNFLRADGTWQIPAYPTVPVGSNPTASVGLAAVNGAAATFMRSDAAPALDVTIAPTWSGQHIFTARFHVQGDTNLLQLENTAAAAYAQFGTVKGWTGAGVNIADTAIGAIGTLNLYGGGSNTQRIGLTGTGIGFHGATPIAKPAVTGSRGANAALASFLTALANYGLITDSSTP